MADLSDDEFRLICVTIRKAVAQLVQVEGMTLRDVLSVAHAEIVGTMTCAFGGLVAAKCSLDAADIVQNLPILDDLGIEVEVIE